MFFFDNPAACEIMWENIVHRGRPQITVWRIRIVWLQLHTQAV